MKTTLDSGTRCDAIEPVTWHPYGESDQDRLSLDRWFAGWMRKHSRGKWRIVADTDQDDDVFNVHMCQAFTGYPAIDPEFPMLYQVNPWCWSPELGFHRGSAP